MDRSHQQQEATSGSPEDSVYSGYSSPNPIRQENSFSAGTSQYPTYQSFSPYIPQVVQFPPTPQQPQFPNTSQPQFTDQAYTPLHRRKRKFQNITYEKLLSEEDLASMTVEEFEDYVNELKDRRTITKTEKATLNKIKRKLKNKESARKSRQKSKEAFVNLQQQLDELKKQYDDVLRINCQLIEIADGCERCRQRIRQVQQPPLDPGQANAQPPHQQCQPMFPHA
ncbi:bZIP transcription factor domain containing protein [Entamoeba histolytica HM-1:IMSS-B]|uniref:BZIP domain-containing protein n=8 Tax=Entamoeba TaxID=5758 RepID=C4LY83_ENTH1|nr:bZIP transcription factor domain containing protein [Entamoeba nuttalli P19]XP_653400.1 hypothetical protein EHI_051930 [Entamoeba histolytica HM-1:IMSS]EMD48885.1 bZIP transcription factor domain containing protein [Entamoeba histolytica KU27]EMH76778.1 bZIP transcription factor domain containing protein [Entamoeba histolytica HM-1:IMSS-B]EMS16367.1 bZIP transcription factor domain containing protein [Entamoeba histolytica HM-3:IMSS]ENY63387.1 bZIP transcription factor domain containing pr|eukprot:XP_008860362.1 bZIP transcription factor domain containing protein [Entamoeba nuttalli P19]